MGSNRIERAPLSKVTCTGDFCAPAHPHTRTRWTLMWTIYYSRHHFFGWILVSFWSVRLFFFVFQGMIGSWMSLPSTRWGFHRIFVLGDGLLPIILSKIVRTLKLYFMRVIKYESPDMPWHVDNPLSSLSSWLWCWCMMPWVDCQVVMLDLCELWRLGVEYMPQLQMYEECGCCKFKSYTCNILQPARWSAQWALWEVRDIYIYICTYIWYIYIYGERLGVPRKT